MIICKLFDNVYSVAQKLLIVQSRASLNSLLSVLLQLLPADGITIYIGQDFKLQRYVSKVIHTPFTTCQSWLS
jgi:hypothetical protein